MCLSRNKTAQTDSITAGVVISKLASHYQYLRIPIPNAAMAPWSSVCHISGDQGSISCRNRPKSLKLVVTAPLQNAKQQVRVLHLRVLGNDSYKRMSCIGVAR